MGGSKPFISFLVGGLVKAYIPLILDKEWHLLVEGTEILVNS